MNKSELINFIAEEADLSKEKADRALAAFQDAVTRTLQKGESIVLVGWGSFVAKVRQARTGRNPSTGKEMHIPATTVAAFKAGAKLKEAVSGKKKD